MSSQWNRREFLSKTPALAAGAAAAAGFINVSPPAAAQESLGKKQDDGVEREYLDFEAEDKGRSWGLYYRPKGKNPKVAALLMHPNASNVTHFLTRRLAARGYGVLGVAGRFNADPARVVPEACLLDIAAHIRTLRDNYGVEKFIGIGHSGGGGLYCLYQGQATTQPPGRLTATPAGDPPDLNKFEMTPFDAVVCLAAHEGEGKIFLHRVDPSVVDEDDPLATDSSLDMYDPRNGFKKYPESSKYSPEFVERYLPAQLARSKRLDAKAFELVARQRRAQERMKSPEFEKLALDDQIMIRRTAYFEPYMTIYRVSAMLSMADLSMDPSDRLVGNGSDPEKPNFQGQGGEASVMTARGYLATWSATHSRMVTYDNLKKISAPTLIMVGTSDLDETPDIIRRELEISAATDKTLTFIKGATHGFTPVEPAAGGKNTQDEAATVIAAWLNTRFPV